MDFRRARPDDAALLAALNAHVQDLHLAGEPEVYRPTVLGEVVAHFQTQLAKADCVVILAEEGGEALGCVVTTLASSPGHAFAHPRRCLLAVSYTHRTLPT